MHQIAIVGASSSIARALIEQMKSQDISIVAYSRKFIENSNDLIRYIKLDDYSNIEFSSGINQLIICNGIFESGSFLAFDLNDIKEFIRVNLEIPTIIIRRFLKATDSHSKRDIFVFGSAAAYDKGALTALYSSTKAGLQALLTSLNNEYRDLETKFSLISTGTVNNEMGLKVLDQDFETLIDVQDLAKEISRRIMNTTNFFEPEILIRRRRMQAHR